MAFDQTQSKSKNQFAARIVSAKTGAMLGWFHPVDEFARRVCGVNNVTEMTAAMALEKLPVLLDGDRSMVAITDMTAAYKIVAAEDF